MRKEDRSLETRLEHLLSESPESAERRERSAFDELASPFENRLVLFGAGGLGRRTVAGLRQAGLEPLAFTDNNPSLWGKEIEGVRVLAPDRAVSELGSSAAFIVTIWNGNTSGDLSAVLRHLLGLGCRKVLPFGFLYWKYASSLLPYYCLDRPSKVLRAADRVLAAFRLWSDSASRREYLQQIMFRLWFDFDGLGHPEAAEQYFSSGLFRHSHEEVFVDCGAFDGDTIRTFLRRHRNQFARVLAFEPDDVSRRRLHQWTAALPDELKSRITVFDKAVGSYRHAALFNMTGTVLSAVGDGGSIVECVTLDEALSGYAPSLMKFDIEGEELQAIAGGGNVIRRHLPVLIISSYHRQDHLWQIPLEISGLSDEYALHLRPEAADGWDLNCYAVPPGRRV